jgi:serine/threonine protein kinase
MRVDLVRLREATAKLVRGLCAPHQAGKLHRDLKPSNVLVDSSHRIVILDFGLVSELSPEVSPTAAGAPGYNAPEQAAHGTVAEPSDWYSVGVMLYDALTGRLPNRHAGRIPPAMCRRI